MACIHRKQFSKVFVNFLLDRREKVYYNAEHHHLGEGVGVDALCISNDG